MSTTKQPTNRTNASASTSKPAPKQAEAFLDDFADEGLEGMQTSDNFLKIAQSNTPEVMESLVKQGHFFDSVNKRDLGSSVNLIVIKQLTCWMVWKDRDQGGGLVGVHLVNGIPVVVGDKNKLYDQDGNNVVETFNYYVVVEGHEDLGLLILPLSSTQIKYAKKWNSMIATLRTPNGNRAAIFQGVWKLETVLNSNASGKWFNIGVDNMSKIEYVRNITKDEFDGFITDARDIAQYIEIGSSNGNDKGQLAIEHETLKDI